MSGKEFEGQREGEEVLIVFRRHVVTTQRGWWFFLIMGLLGWLPMLIWKDVDQMIFVWMGFVLIGLMGWAYAYMLWYFSVYVITTERLRQIRQKGLFRRTMVDLSLSKIEGISCDVSGVGGALFGYGTLLVQTVAGDLTLSKISSPETAYNELQNAVQAVEAGRE